MGLFVNSVDVIDENDAHINFVILNVMTNGFFPFYEFLRLFSNS